VNEIYRDEADDIEFRRGERSRIPSRTSGRKGDVDAVDRPVKENDPIE
jgi:hypothetical protein